MRGLVLAHGHPCQSLRPPSSSCLASPHATLGAILTVRCVCASLEEYKNSWILWDTASEVFDIQRLPGLTMDTVLTSLYCAFGTIFSFSCRLTRDPGTILVLVRWPGVDKGVQEIVGIWIYWEMMWKKCFYSALLARSVMRQFSELWCHFLHEDRHADFFVGHSFFAPLVPGSQCR